MKKLSIVLVLLFALTCSLLAACGDETETSSTSDSSVAESAAAESSKVEEASTAEDSSVAESSTVEDSSAVEDTSDPAESSEEISNAPVGEGSNIAKNAKYTVTGCGDGYVVLESDWGPSIYNAPLTDGIAHEELTFGDTKNWFGLYYNQNADANIVSAPDGVGAIVIDLGAKKDISGVRVHFGNHFDNGIPSPDSAVVYISDDGKNFTKYGELPIKSTDDAANKVLAYWSEVGGSASAQYVKVEIDLAGVFAFLNEIEVIG